MSHFTRIVSNMSAHNMTTDYHWAASAPYTRSQLHGHSPEVAVYNDDINICVVCLKQNLIHDGTTSTNWPISDGLQHICRHERVIEVSFVSECKLTQEKNFKSGKKFNKISNLNCKF